MLDEVIVEDDLCLGCGGNITPTLFPGFLCQGCRESYGQKMRLLEQEGGKRKEFVVSSSERENNEKN